MAVNTAEAPGQIVKLGLPLTVIVGLGLTVILIVLVPGQPGTFWPVTV